MATPPVPQPPSVPNPNKLAIPAAPPPGMVPPPPGVARAGAAAVAVGGAQVQNQPTVDENPGEEGEQLERSLWQMPFSQDYMPIITSVMLHIAIVAIGLAGAKAIQVITQITKEPVIIPDATIVENAQVGGIKNPGLGGDPEREAAQDKFKDVPENTQGIMDKPSTSLTQALTGGGAGETDDSDIAFGANSVMGKGKGSGVGKGEGVGGGTGDGGALAKFGRPGGGGGIGPKAAFMGTSGNAMKVVYLCDSSGSMMTKFDVLKSEIRKAVSTLKPIQSFDVIFFAQDDYKALDKTLLLAVPENVRKAYEFLDKTNTVGSSDPVPGLRAAFATQPQLIYMLTDGDFPNNTAVLEEIRKLNKDRKVKINTIAFMDRGEDYEKLLKAIADETGGVFKFVSEKELQQ